MPGQVIDLATESSGQPAIDTLDPTSADPPRNGQKPKRKKKSSNSKSSSTPEVPSTPTLSDSNYPTKRKRIHETSGSNERCSNKRDSGEPDSTDHEFFVDLLPTAIPSMPVSQESTTNIENETVEKLLLPSHVTVFGNALVEIISQPLSGSDDDEFIKYLDYEDTRVCTQ